MTAATLPTTRRDAADEPGVRTIVTRVRERAASAPSRVAMREKVFGVWQEVTWAEYWDTVLTVGHGLLSLDVQPGDRVGVLSENRREWLYADLATVAVRGATTGLYSTNPWPEVRHILADSGARVLVAEDQEQVDKVLDILRDDSTALPALEHVVYMEPRGLRGRYDHPLLMSWDELFERGAQHRERDPGAVEARMAAATSDDMMSLIYTSGTTSAPKGAMLSVVNVEFAIESLVEKAGFLSPPAKESDVVLSYLPLCHVAERLFTTWFNAGAGVQVNFAESIATVQQNLAEIQPTILFGVPRIWEKILAGVRIRLSSASRVKRGFGIFWLGIADRIGDHLVESGGRHTGQTRILSAIGHVFMFRALRDRMGMRKVRYAASGAAPIAPEVLKFFMGIGVPMHEVYGMTEQTAVATANRPGRIRLGTVGEPHWGVEVRIDEATGEILTRHPGTFVGYWQDDDATGRTMNPDGWLRTGDVGEWVDGTHVRITDRMKDIVITAGGMNVAPSPIENQLKTSPFVKEAVVIGDRRTYLTALVGIELDTVGEWAQRRRLPYTTYRDLTEKPEIVTLVRGIVDEVNSRHAPVEQIRAFRLLPKELDHEDGELTGSQKVKRSAIMQRYAGLVDSMYRTAS
ncbi:MAG: AMP-dependent synthetase/ligase [Jiangellaceae bacterium]